MAKKSTKKSKLKKATVSKRYAWTKEDRLKQVIYYSERAMDGSGGSMDELFKGQVDRAKKELDQLKAKK